MNQTSRKTTRSKSQSSQFKRNKRGIEDEKDKHKDFKDINLDHYYDNSKYRSHNYDDYLTSPDYTHDNYYYNYDDYNYNFDDYNSYNKPYNLPEKSDEKLLKDYLDRKSLQPTKTLKEKEDDLYRDYNLDDKYKENSDYNKSGINSLTNYNTINSDNFNKYSLDRNNGYYNELSSLNRFDYDDDYLKKNYNDENDRNDYYSELKSLDKDYYNYYDDYKDIDYKDDYKDDDYKDIGDSNNNYYNYTNYIYNNYYYNDHNDDDKNNYDDDNYLNKYDDEPNIKKNTQSELRSDALRKIKLNALREETKLFDPKKKLNFDSNIKSRHTLFERKSIKKKKKPLNIKFNEIDNKITKTISESRIINNIEKYNSKTLNSRQYRSINKSQDFMSKNPHAKGRGLSLSQKGPKNKIIVKGIKQKPPSKTDIKRREEKSNNKTTNSYSSFQIERKESTGNTNSRPRNNNMVEIKYINSRPPNPISKAKTLSNLTKSTNDAKTNTTTVSISNKTTSEKSTVNKNNDNNNGNEKENNNNNNDNNNKINTDKNNNKDRNNNNENNNKINIDKNNNKEKNNNSDNNKKNNENNNTDNNIITKKKSNTIDNNNNKENSNDSNKNNNNNKNNNEIKTSLVIDDNTHGNNVIVDINKNQKIEKAYASVNRLKNLQNNLARTFTKKECETCHKQIETHLYKIHCNAHPTEIFRWLFLGTFENACDINELKRIRVTHILNCASECKNTKLPSNIKELHLNINDYEGFEIFDYFDEANEFLHNCKENVGIALVHCKYGISRSVAFIIAYLIKYLKFSADSALEYLMQKRSKIKPNDGFMDQLREYERMYAP